MDDALPNRRDPADLQVRLRALPSVDELLHRPSLQAAFSNVSHVVAARACREAVALVRARVLRGEGADVLDADVARALAAVSTPRLRKVLNATGVVLHTNLGRAPLPARAIERITQVASGYSNLELDLERGERGSRYEPVVELLTSLTGAEAALVVNNGAAAVLLALSALGSGREAIVSRGELVEIGGGFRVPDVMRQSGVRLVEVGTTNRTKLADYENALSPETALLVKVHRSNFALVGFTDEVSTKELAALAKARGVVMFEDLGSGQLRPMHGEGLGTEPTVASAIAAGAPLVACSGDKLLGGPQAGILVGSKALIAKLEKHPLNRALRIDKLTVAALEATLELYRDGREDSEVPVRAMLAQPAQALQARAARLSALLEARRVGARVIEVTGQVGGGSMPLAAPKSFAVAIAAPRAMELHDALRGCSPPIVARIADDQVLLDVRCLSDDDLPDVAEGVATCLGAQPC